MAHIETGLIWQTSRGCAAASALQTGETKLAALPDGWHAGFVCSPGHGPTEHIQAQGRSFDGVRLFEYFSSILSTL